VSCRCWKDANGSSQQSAPSRFTPRATHSTRRDNTDHLLVRDRVPAGQHVSGILLGPPTSRRPWMSAAPPTGPPNTGLHSSSGVGWHASRARGSGGFLGHSQYADDRSWYDEVRGDSVPSPTPDHCEASCGEFLYLLM
jgi:hypothetical protein